MICSCGVKWKIKTVRPVMSRRAAIWFSLVCALAWGGMTTDGHAQLDLPTIDTGPSPASDLSDRIGDIQGITQTLQDRIVGATQKLEQVEGLDPTALEQEISQMFAEIRAQVEVILEETGQTSALRDAFGRARETTRVFLNDLNLKPPTHINRDQNIMRLENALEQYSSLEQNIERSREQASEQLLQLMRMQNSIIEDVRIGIIEQALENTGDVVASLEELAAALREIQPPEIDPTFEN